MDEAVYSDALQPRSRRTAQSPRVLTAEFADGNIQCTIDMDGQIESSEMTYQARTALCWTGSHLPGQQPATRTGQPMGGQCGQSG